MSEDIDNRSILLDFYLKPPGSLSLFNTDVKITPCDASNNDGTNADNSIITHMDSGKSVAGEVENLTADVESLEISSSSSSPCQHRESTFSAPPRNSSPSSSSTSSLSLAATAVTPRPSSTTTSRNTPRTRLRHLNTNSNSNSNQPTLVLKQHPQLKKLVSSSTLHHSHNHFHHHNCLLHIFRIYRCSIVIFNRKQFFIHSTHLDNCLNIFIGTQFA